MNIKVMGKLMAASTDVANIVPKATQSGKAKTAGKTRKPVLESMLATVRTFNRKFSGEPLASMDAFIF